MKPYHSKATPLILRTAADVERSLQGTTAAALELQKPAKKGSLIVVPEEGGLVALAPHIAPWIDGPANEPLPCQIPLERDASGLALRPLELEPESMLPAGMVGEDQPLD